MNRLAADYYPYHVEESLWPRDFKLMRECGIDLVRFLCFDWSAIEPDDEVYNFDWAHRLMKLAEHHGVQVQLTAPTAGPPPWLMTKYPQCTQNGSSKVSARRQYCPSHPLYRTLCQRITTRIIEELGGYSNVWGYQIDNELGFNFCKCASCLTRFHEWLRQRRGSDIRELNRAWGLKFWSREFNGWDQVGWEQIGSPESQLDAKRFYSFIITEFMNDIATVIREKAPGKTVSTNFMGNFEMVDYWQTAKTLDVVGYDFYPFIYTMESASLAGDLMRGLKKQLWWTFENGTDSLQPTDWTVMYAVKQWAHGEIGHMIFHWQQFNTGSEQVLGGILDHAGRPTRMFDAAKRTHEIYAKLPELSMTDFKSEIAIVYDYDCFWAHQSLHQHPQNYFYVTESVYKSFNRLGTLVDVIHPSDDFSKYKVVVFPSHIFADESVTRRLREFVKAGGLLIATPLSFTHDRNLQWIAQPPPVGLTDVFGATCREGHFSDNYIGNHTSFVAHDIISLSGVSQGEQLTYALHSTLPFLNGIQGEKYFERLELLDGGEALATYADGHYKNEAAVTSKQFGTGRAVFVGSFLPEATQRALFKHLLTLANVSMFPPANAEVEVVPLRRHRVFLNHTPVAVREPRPAGRVLVGQADNQQLLLEPYGFAIVETP